MISYKVVDLGTLGGDRSWAHDINDPGQVVGGAFTSDGQERAFLYSNGVMENLRTLWPGGGRSWAHGIYDSGDLAVWSASVDSESMTAFFYNGDRLWNLTRPGSNDPDAVLVDAFAINDNTWIVASGSKHGQGRAFLLVRL